MRNLTIKTSLIASIYTCVSLCLLRIPLFNILGYEFAFTMAFVTYFTSGLALILSADEGYPGGPLKPIKAVVFYFILSLVPVLVMTIKGIFSTNCNYSKGLCFYLLLAGVSSVFSTSLSTLLKVFVRRRFPGALLFLFVSLLILAKFPFELLFGPNVDSFNHIFGYFAGPIYDEIVEIRPSLVWYRIYTLSLSGLMLSLPYVLVKLKDRKNPALLSKEMLVTLSFFILSTVFFFSGKPFGYARSSAFVKQKLGFKTSTKDFDFYHVKDEKLILPDIVNEFEFRYSQLKKYLKVGDQRIEVYLYPDIKTQKVLMGSRGVFIGKPSNSQVHMLMRSPLNEPIKHELTHVLAGQFGLPVLKLSPRIALVEGLAVAAVGYVGPMTLHEACANLLDMGLDPDIKSLMKISGFFSAQASRAYIASGSFCEFIIARYSMDRFKK